MKLIRFLIVVIGSLANFSVNATASNRKVDAVHLDGDGLRVQEVGYSDKDDRSESDGSHNSLNNVRSGGIIAYAAKQDVDGSDTLIGGAGDDTIVGNDDGNDTLFGGAGDDTIVGNDDGNDTIYGGAGDDTIVGNDDGNDTLFGGAGDDTLLEGEKLGRN